MIQETIKAKRKKKVPPQGKWRFVLKGSKNKQFCFTLRAPNNKIVMVSETYRRKQSAEKSMLAITIAFHLNGPLEIVDKTI